MIQVVTDSTCDLPSSLVEEYRIHVVPLNVHFGSETFREGVDLNAEEFYSRLTQSKVLPTTSQPSVGAFLEVYRGLLDQAEAIISIHISQKLSGTYNSALKAKEELGAAKIEVVDSELIGIGMGLVVLEAARAAQQGAGPEEVLARTRQAISEVQTFILFETLEYLARGGRIGKARAFLGSLLGIKPIIHVKEGEVHPFERVRTKAKGLERLLALARANSPLKEAGVVYSTNREEGEELATRLSHIMPREKIILSRLGPVLGTHGGPGLVGLAFRRG